METVDIPHSNKKGEIWFQECVCGKQQEVMFNHDGECVSIKPKQRWMKEVQQLKGKPVICVKAHNGYKLGDTAIGTETMCMYYSEYWLITC